MGFAHSKGDNVLFLNNDIRIKSNYTDWTNLVIEQCDNLVGLSMGQLDNGFNFIREEKKELSGNSYMSGWFLASSRKNWDIIATNNGGKVWNELLPFYFNDCDLSFRVKKLGIPLKVISPPIVHFGKISASQLNVSSLYLTGRKAFLEIWEHKR
jgi:GT2 family glycosyltransferase